MLREISPCANRRGYLRAVLILLVWAAFQSLEIICFSQH